MKTALEEVQFRYRGEQVPVSYLAIQQNDRAAGHPLRLPFYRIYPHLDELNSETGKQFRLLNPCLAGRLMSKDRSTAYQVMGDLPFATDGIIAYGKPGEKLGAELVFYEGGTPRLILPTGKYHGEKDVALVVISLSSADFVEEGRDIRLQIAEGRFMVVEDFPAEKGSYKKHKDVPVPCGQQCGEDDRGTVLLHRVKGHYVGNMARYGRPCGDTFTADLMPWDKLGAFVTVPDDAVELIAACTAPQELLVLIREARKELEDVSETLRPEKTAALRKLVMLALEAKEE
jgi:hypothetical protein